MPSIRCRMVTSKPLRAQPFRLPSYPHRRLVHRKRCTGLNMLRTRSMNRRCTGIISYSHFGQAVELMPEDPFFFFFFFLERFGQIHISPARQVMKVASAPETHRSGQRNIPQCWWQRARHLRREQGTCHRSQRLRVSRLEHYNQCETLAPLSAGTRAGAPKDGAHRKQKCARSLLSNERRGLQKGRPAITQLWDSRTSFQLKYRKYDAAAGRSKT